MRLVVTLETVIDVIIDICISLCTYQPHVHLAHLAREALSPHCFIMIKSVYMLNCTLCNECKSIQSCHYVMLVKLYDHAPHVYYCMYEYYFVCLTVAL